MGSFTIFWIFSKFMLNGGKQVGKNILFQIHFLCYKRHFLFGAPSKATRLHTWALYTKRWNQLDAIYWWHQWLRFILQFKIYPTNTQRKGKIHTSLCKSVLKTNGVQVRARSHWHSVTTRAYITKIAATEMHLKKFFVGVRSLLDLAAEPDR